MLPGLWQPSAVESPFVMIIVHEGADRLSDLTRELELPALNYLLIKPHDDSAGEGCPREFLEDACVWLEEQGYSRSHIFWLGLAGGCRPALEFGARAHHEYRGFIGISGYYRDTWIEREHVTDAARRGAWLISHGTQDELSPVVDVRRSIKSLAAHGLPIMYCEFEKGHDIDYDTEVPMIRQWIKRRL